MCQWGTSAWAKASKNWSWMVNHYYNDEGKGTGKRTLTMTSPIEVTQASVSPGSVSPGGSVDVSAILRSYAEDDHPAILLRTSIVPGSGASIANPNGVGQLTASGTGGAAHKDTSATQKFAVGTSVAAGTYDLLVEVILDANGSKTVDAVDILLASKTVAHALTVGAVTPVDAGSSGGSKDSGVRPDATAKADADGLEQDPDSGEAGSDSGVAPDAHGAARDGGSGTPTSPPAACGCSTPGASMEWLLALALLLPGLRRPGRASRARS